MRCLGKDITIEANNLNICYHDEGPIDAPVIIFIHGFPLNKSIWDQQIENFQANYRVIAYDIRGHGGSEAGSEEFTIELFADDLLSFMDTLQINQAMLCGLSMGGYIALTAIANHPERFEALILCSTQCVADTMEGKEKRLKTIEGIKNTGVEQFADGMIKNLFAEESTTIKAAEIEYVRNIIRQTSTESLCNTLLALSTRKETCSRLHAIEIPVLILAGQKDIITPPAVMEQLHAKIENSNLHFIEHTGHLLNIENPAEFNNQLRQFVQKAVSRHLQLQELNDLD